MAYPMGADQRNFQQQRVSRVFFSIDGKEVPFKAKPLPTDLGYWTVKHNDREPRPVSVVEMVVKAPVAPSFAIHSEYEGVEIRNLPLVHSTDKPALPRVELNEEQKATYLRMDEPGCVNLPLAELRETLSRHNLLRDPSKETPSQFIVRALYEVAKVPYAEGRSQDDVKKVLDERVPGNCNEFAYLGMMVARGNGIPSRLTHGWVLYKDAAHAISQVYLEDVGQWFDVGWTDKHRANELSLFADGSPTLRFDMNLGHIITAGRRYSQSLGSGGSWGIYDQASKLRFTMNAIGNFDAKQSYLRDLTPHSPEWVSFDPAAK